MGNEAEHEERYALVLHWQTTGYGDSIESGLYPTLEQARSALKLVKWGYQYPYGYQEVTLVDREADSDEPIETKDLGGGDRITDAVVIEIPHQVGVKVYAVGNCHQGDIDHDWGGLSSYHVFDVDTHTESSHLEALRWAESYDGHLSNKVWNEVRKFIERHGDDLSRIELYSLRANEALEEGDDDRVKDCLKWLAALGAPRPTGKLGDALDRFTESDV